MQLVLLPRPGHGRCRLTDFEPSLSSWLDVRHRRRQLRAFRLEHAPASLGRH